MSFRSFGVSQINAARIVDGALGRGLRLTNHAAVAAVYAVVHVLAARRRRRERVAATEFKAKVAPYLVEAPEL